MMQYSDIDIVTLRKLATNATPGPWRATLFEYEVHGSHKLSSYRLDTTWHHGQLKGPAPVLAPALSIRPHPAKPAELAIQDVLAIHPDDATYMAAASPDVVLCLLQHIAFLEDAQRPFYPVSLIGDRQNRHISMSFKTSEEYEGAMYLLGPVIGEEDESEVSNVENEEASSVVESPTEDRKKGC